MPLPMVHLAVAVRLQAAFPSPAFLLGSLAPDAIHAREGSCQADKLRVHLAETGVVDGERVRALLAEHCENGPQPGGFVGGYAAHLLTDRKWLKEVITPFREKLPAEFTDQQVRQVYYRDTDRIDMELHRRMPWREEVWKNLAEAQPVDFPPHLTAEEIARWRDRTLAWYADPNHDPGCDPKHIPLEMTLDFIDRAVLEMRGIFSGWQAVEL